MRLDDRSAAHTDASFEVGAATRPALARPALLVVVPPAEVGLYSVNRLSRITAHSTTQAIQLIEALRPQVVAIDWDSAEVDGPTLCRVSMDAATLATMTRPEDAPAALKTGCHSILLKPFAPSLLAGRIGRLLRETVDRSALRAAARSVGSPVAGHPVGTNRCWSDVTCAQCGTPGATSFEFSSRRRAWYACLSCESVWVARGRE